ncbi:MAG TPA: hypothetical protein PLF17_10910 [Chitinophagaceae bacterium]|nr:hypothetical protein [Chitinophagaceae bacterium]HRA71206.1 hypothetical protein [Flavobacterium sp.]
MSLEFIQSRKNARNITVASKQQKQIAYFTQSNIQEDITIEYLKQWANRNYRGDDYFLNWIKTIFRTENFLSFYKYLRFPLPSAKLINDEIKPQLKRVYFADDSYFRYSINGKEVETPDVLKNEAFEDLLFNAILFNYNDIIVHDMDDINSSYRELLCIDNVLAIDSDNGVIKELCYSAEAIVDGEKVHGILYLNDKAFVFYDSKGEKELLNIPHDLGICPACWVSNEAFSTDNDIVRKSMFSYVREELEEYVFLKTLLKMTEPNGAIPITVKLKTNDKPKDGNDISGANDAQPMSPSLIGSQTAKYGKEVQGSNSPLQAGTVVSVPIVKDNNGNVNTDIIQNFAKFFYIPVESLNYMNKRITQIERSIIMNVLGDYMEMNDEIAKNEFQVGKSFTNKQDKLRYLAMNMTWTRKQSDYQILGLNYGTKNISVDIFYGSDFYLDDETILYGLLEKAPNQIERRNLLMRIGKTKYRFNKIRAERETLLYSLLPFTSDKDFDKGLEQMLVDDTTKKLQLRFDYWISMFEAEYGDILIFYNNFVATSSEKLIAINNLLTNLIKQQTNE